MHNVLVSGLLVVCASIASAPAASREWPVYVGVGYGIGDVQGSADTGTSHLLEDDIASIDGMTFDDDDPIWSAFAGYEINRHVAIEVGYTDLGRYAAEPWLFFRDVELDIRSAYLTGRLRYPLGDRLALVGHLGVNKTTFDEHGHRFSSVFDEQAKLYVFHFPLEEIDDTTGYLAGVGVEVRFTNWLSAAVEYSRHEVDVLDVDAANLRLLFHL